MPPAGFDSHWMTQNTRKCHGSECIPSWKSPSKAGLNRNGKNFTWVGVVGCSALRVGQCSAKSWPWDLTAVAFYQNSYPSGNLWIHGVGIMTTHTYTIVGDEFHFLLACHKFTSSQRKKMFDKLSTFFNINNNNDFATFYKLMSYGCGDLEIAKNNLPICCWHIHYIFLTLSWRPTNFKPASCSCCFYSLCNVTLFIVLYFMCVCVELYCLLVSM